MQNVENTIRPSSIKSGMCYLLAVAFNVAMAFGMTFLIRHIVAENPDADMTWLTNLDSVAFEFVFLAFPAMLFYKARHPGSEKSMRLQPPSFSMFWYAAILAILSVYLLNALEVFWCMLLEKLGMTITGSSFGTPRNTLELMGQVLLVAALPGVCEELFFRSYTLPALEKHGKKTALYMTALLFAMMHGSADGFPVHFLQGLILGILTIESGCAYTSMAYHTVYNAALVIINYMQSMLGVNAEMEGLSTTQLVAENGGVGFYIGEMIIIGGIFAAILVVAVHKWRRKRGITVSEEQISPMPMKAKLLYLAGAVIMLGMYALDILEMLGVVRI